MTEQITVEQLIEDALDAELPGWVRNIPFSAETKLAALLHVALELALKIRVPDDWGAEAEVREHKDLRRMSDFQLWRWRKRLELYLAISEDPETEHFWYQERLAAIAKEQARRKRVRR